MDDIRRDLWIPNCLLDSTIPISGVRLIANVKWLHFITVSEKDEEDISGKYLFFSQDQEMLIRIAISEIHSGRIDEAKVNQYAEPGDDYVLCLYDSGPNLCNDMRKRYASETVMFRGWKSDEDTRKGLYSERYRRRFMRRTG